MPTPRLLALAAAFAGLILTAAAPTPVPLGKEISWDAKKDGDPKTYAVGGLRLTFASTPPAEKDDNPTPVLTVVSPRFGRIVLTGQEGMQVPTAQAAVVARLDPKADGPAVVYEDFSGGAHCCTRVTILDPIGGAWRKVDGGEWNGGPEVSPKDRDGDGTPDFLLEDEDFRYAFGCYACTPAPPQVFNVVGGAWTDVSKAARYRPVFQKAARDLRPLCGAPVRDGGMTNGPCAAYVAAAARVGGFDAAWRFMLAHYDHQSTDWPNGCRVALEKDPCPKAQEILYKTYPEALRAFLLKHGYIAAS